MMSEMVKWLNSDLKIHPVLTSGIAQFQLRSLTVMVGLQGYCQLFVFTKPDMISNGCSPSVNIMIVTGPPSMEVLCPEVNRRSLQRDLKAFLEKGLIKETGAGPTDPTRHYVLS